MCLPVCASISFNNACRMLILTKVWPAFEAVCAADSLLVSDVPIPELSIAPSPTSAFTTLAMPVIVTSTVTLTEAECVFDPEVPVTFTV